MALAMKLNGLLASPSFAAWAEGPPLDIQSMLYTPDGKPRCAIVTTAHLSDEERQFVTSLMLSKLVTWMRRQSGTTDLRAMLYMDEVAGYLPPTANPPTKKPIMTLMKQARAFGVGVVLSTQNPVDIDYKAISNAGTWMIGRLQTDRDKERLLDGLSTASGGVDVAAGRRHDLGARQARVRAAPGRQGHDRGVHHPLGDELPAGPDDPRSDRRADGRRARPPPARRPLRRPGGGVVARPTRRAGPPHRPSQLADDETAVMPEVADGIPVRWVDVGVAVAGRCRRRLARARGSGAAIVARCPAPLRRDQGRPRPRRRVRVRDRPRSARRSTSSQAIAGRLRRPRPANRAARRARSTG